MCVTWEDVWQVVAWLLVCGLSFGIGYDLGREMRKPK